MMIIETHLPSFARRGIRFLLSSDIVLRTRKVADNCRVLHAIHLPPFAKFSWITAENCEDFEKTVGVGCIEVV